MSHPNGWTMEEGGEREDGKEGELVPLLIWKKGSEWAYWGMGRAGGTGKGEEGTSGDGGQHTGSQMQTLLSLYLRLGKPVDNNTSRHFPDLPAANISIDRG